MCSTKYPSLSLSGNPIFVATLVLLLYNSKLTVTLASFSVTPKLLRPHLFLAFAPTYNYLATPLLILIYTGHFFPLKKKSLQDEHNQPLLTDVEKEAG